MKRVNIKNLAGVILLTMIDMYAKQGGISGIEDAKWLRVSQKEKEAIDSIVGVRAPHKKAVSSHKKKEMILSLLDKLEKQQDEQQKIIALHKNDLARERQEREAIAQKVVDKDKTIAELVATKEELHNKSQKAEQECELLKAQLLESTQQVAGLQLHKTQYDQYIQELQVQNMRLEQQVMAHQREFELKKEEQLAVQLKERREKERVLSDELDEVQKELKAARLELQALKLEKKIDRYQQAELSEVQKTGSVKEKIS